VEGATEVEGAVEGGRRQGATEVAKVGADVAAAATQAKEPSRRRGPNFRVSCLLYISDTRF